MILLKRCPRCGRTYSDLSYSYCLEDGVVLSPPVDESSIGEYETEIATVVKRPAMPTMTGSTMRADITEPALLITVNKLYKPDIKPEILYEITRGVWRIGERRNNAKYAFAVYKGIIREVYEIESWKQAEADSAERKEWIVTNKIDVPEVTRQRWQFEGHIAPNLQHYIGQSVAHYRRRGDASPVKYVNC